MSIQRRERQTQRKIAEAIRRAESEGKLSAGEVYVLNVRHEERCAMNRGKTYCTCNPEIQSPQRVTDPEEN